MKKLIVFPVIFLIFCLQTFAYSSLYTTNPRSGWYNYPAQIEEASLHIIPKGIYFQHELTMSVSALAEYYNEGDTLEIVYNFSLPEGSKILESYLLVEDSMVRADLRDTWTAQAIYEGIVNRRKDPSILTKTGNNEYHLRIFPLALNESRQFSITYLTPGDLSNKEITTILPAQMLTSDRDNTVDLVVTSPKNTQYGAPRFLNPETGELSFFTLNQNERWQQVISVINQNQLYQIGFDFKYQSGAYLSLYQESDEQGYYQFAILPESILEKTKAKKYFFLIDYDAYTTSNSKKEIITIIKNQLHKIESNQDSLMLMCSSLNIHPVREQWMSFDSTNIEVLFNELNNDDITNYSNLPSLLAKAITLISDDENAELVLLSSSNNQGSYKTANDLFGDLQELTDKLPVIHTTSICNQNIAWFNQGNRYFMGNEYFYTLLTRNTGGNMNLSGNGENIETNIEKTFTEISGIIHAPDLYATTTDGFCYNRFNIQTNSNFYKHKPLIQVGRYYGTAPFDITFSGVFEEVPFSEHITIKDNIQTSDSTLQQFWAGEEILRMESQIANIYLPPNELVHSIVNTSMDYHVLSKFTAFLALEPGMEPDFDPDANNNNDDFWLTETDELIDEIEPIRLKPNPFSESLTIDIHLPDSLMSDNLINIKIVDATGKTVKTFDNDLYSGQRDFSLSWYGEDMQGRAIQCGIYILIIEHKTGILTKKIVKQ